MTSRIFALTAAVLAALAGAAAADPPRNAPGETIEIHDYRPPAVLPKAKNFVASKAPPYSDAAILSDAWTKAWMLLDVDEHGDVTRVKFLKRPGYDLENIATKEAFRLKFEPARDEKGNRVKTLVVWPIEWPSAGWLITFTGTRSRMPETVGFPPRSQAAFVPCAGSGPWRMGSIYPAVYKDCSRPDLKRASKEAWILPKT